MHYAANGIACVVRDTSERRIDEINSAQLRQPRFEEWTGIPLDPLIESGVLRAIAAGSPIPQTSAHIVAVPTESDGVPDTTIVEDVIDRVARTKPWLCLVESTLTPGTCKRLCASYPEMALAVAPRRDWFLGDDKTLETLPRVFAGEGQIAHERASALIGRVSRDLRPAATCEVAELTKCIENSLHHVIAMYCTQLARAYPDESVAEALDLAASHWRIKTKYFASAGTGGYCVPVATSYLRAGSEQSDVLSIGTAALAFESDQRKYIAGLLSDSCEGVIGILGLTYRGDVPSAALSPFMDIATLLANAGRVVLAHDPYVAAPSNGNHSVRAMGFPAGLARCETIFVGAAHRIYRDIPTSVLLSHLRPDALILDNEGAWARHRDEFLRAGVRYARIGEPLPMRADDPIE